MRIGIVSHYYRSHNYGALLQAYALCSFVNIECGVDCEQVCIPVYCEQNHSMKERIKKLFNLKKLLVYLGLRMKNMLLRVFVKNYEQNQYIRNAAMERFELEIPHTSTAYTNETIENCMDGYDAMITGSDQVWNYTWYNPAFFLSFYNSPKISYAASIGHSDIPAPWKNEYKMLLKDFLAISVREEDAVSMLQPISPVDVKWVLDPTLIVPFDWWDKLCVPQQINERYLFCYFLGGNKRDRNTAREVAKEKKLKIVTLPHLGDYRICDESFGDIQLWDVTPQKLLSLIRYADYVLTDSFHVSVFSLIFNTPFAAFERDGSKDMGGRLLSLTKLAGAGDRFLDSFEKATSKYICNLSDQLPPETENMKKMKEQSKRFLLDCINEVKRKVGEV